MNFLNKQNFSLILFLIPLSFIVGIALTEFFVLLSIIFFLIFNRDKSLFLNKKIIFLFLLSLYVSLNAGFQIHDDLRLSSYVYFRFVIFSLSIFYFCQIFEKVKQKKFFLFMIFAILILLLDAIFQFFYGINFLGFETIIEGNPSSSERNGRISGLFKDELILGSFLIKLLPIILWGIFFFEIDLKKNFYYLIIYFSIYLITIYLSGERTSFFLSIIYITGIFLIIKNLRKILLISSLFFLLFALSTSYFKVGSADPLARIVFKTFHQITNQRFIPNIDRDKVKLDSKNYKIFSRDHEGHINIALKLFDENKIFGAGPKGFRYYCRGVDYNPSLGICSTHPHNILIQIIAELGLIGLTFYIVAGLFVLYNFIYSILNKKFSNEYLAFYSITLGLIIYLFPFIPGGNFFNNWISIMLYYNIGLYLFAYKDCLKNS